MKLPSFKRDILKYALIDIETWPEKYLFLMQIEWIINGKNLKATYTNISYCILNPEVWENVTDDFIDEIHRKNSNDEISKALVVIDSYWLD